VRHKNLDSTEFETYDRNGHVSSCADSCVTLNSEEGYESSLCPVGDETFANSESADIVSLDSGVLFSEQSSMSLEPQAERDYVAGKKVVYIPRSGSGISRKKAFYNAPRPGSINRRRSDEDDAAHCDVHNESITSSDTIVGVNDDTSSSFSTSNDSVVSQIAHVIVDNKSASTSLGPESKSAVDAGSSSMTSLKNTSGVYAPVGFRSSRSSAGTRPVSFLGSRLSAVHVVDET